MILTCVSAYFPVKSKYGNKNSNKYNEWFKTTLAVNCPYVFFTDKKSLNLIKSFRKDLPTYYIECAIEDFYTYQYKNKMITDPIHCPSVKLNLIWNEKMFMMQKAREINPFNSEWFHWIDAGICVYRDKSPPAWPFTNINKLNCLPKNKFIYSQSEKYNAALITKTNYYHHISGTFLLHRDFINTYCEIYKEALAKLVDKNNIWTDQVIHTHIHKDNPALFFKLCDGYGDIAKYLFE